MSIKKKAEQLLCMCIVIVTMSGCASILNGKFQKVSIQTEDNSTVLIDGMTPDKTEKGKFLFRRDARAKQITVKKKGFKDYHTAAIQYKKSPYYAMSVVPFSVAFLLPVLCDNLIKSRNYVSKLSSINQMIPMPEKEKFASILMLNDVTTTPNKTETLSRVGVSYRKFIRGSKSAKKKERKSINLHAGSFSSAMVKLFEDKGYTSYETNDLDKVYLNATLYSYSYHSFDSEAMAYGGTLDNYGNMLYVDLGIKWEVLDHNKKLLFTHQTNNSSGQFAFYKGNQPESLIKAIKDGIEIAFIDLVNTPAFSDILDKRSDDLAHYLKENKKEDDESLIETNYLDTIAITNKSGVLYLSKKNREERATYRGQSTGSNTGAVNKHSFLRMIEDVPELHDYAAQNLNLGRTSFATNLISCYNDYKLTGETKELNQKHFNEFGLITLKEYKKGPSEEMLREKKPIFAAVRQITVTTKHYGNYGELQTTTQGENYRMKFMYGNAQYKSGFLLSNLKKAVGDNQEALKHIRKYRANFAARTAVFLVGIVQLGLAMNWADSGEPPIGSSTTGSIVALAPGLVFLNWYSLFPQKYKSKNISNVINAYNNDYMNK